MQSNFVWLQSVIRSNRLKTFFLILLFPISLFVIMIIVFWVVNYDYITVYGQTEFVNKVLYDIQSVAILLVPVIIIWFTISMYFHKRLIFKFSGAKEITRKENPEIYNIIENLCISRWLPTVKIWILEDDSMNAFATWWWKNARIVLSRWLISKLDKREIEAVAWHELTHIINKDTLLMVIVVVFIGIFTTLGQILIRSTHLMSNKKESWNLKLALFLSGVVFLVVWLLFFPIIRLAISRKREFMADAGSVELTKDRDAMIAALQKISTDSRIESIKKDTVAAMCIESPFDKSSKSSWWSDMRSTHPSIERRIQTLQWV